MNLIADAMVPYLRSNGIQYTRNTPDMTAASSIRQANQGNYDFYLALHSNAAPEGSSGQVRGSLAFYYPTSTNGKRMADIIVRNLKTIYPDPQLVRAVPTTTLGEVDVYKRQMLAIDLSQFVSLGLLLWMCCGIHWKLLTKRREKKWTVKRSYLSKI